MSLEGIKLKSSELLEKLVKSSQAALSSNYIPILAGFVVFILASLVGLFLIPVSVLPPLSDPINLPNRFSLGLPVYYERWGAECIDLAGADCPGHFNSTFRPLSLVLNFLWFGAGFLLIKVFQRWKS